MNDLRSADCDLPTLTDESITNILLCGNQRNDGKANQIILIHAIRDIKIHKDMMDLFSTRLKLLLTSYQVPNFC